MSTVQAGPFRLEVNREKTARFYEGLPLAENQCCCAGCRNFKKAVLALPLPAKEFFASVGVEIAKAYEVYVNTVDDQGMIHYGGFTPICGLVLSGSSAWIRGKTRLISRLRKKYFKLPGSIDIDFQEECFLLPEGFPGPCFQMNFEMCLPWVLPERNPYHADF